MSQESKYNVVDVKSIREGYDETKIIQKGLIHLKDGRPITAELWGDYGYTFLSYYFSVRDIEDITKEELTDYLIEQGIKIDKLKFRNKITAVKKEGIGTYWHVVITVGEN